MSFLKIESISKSFGPEKVLSDVSLELEHGSIGCLLGKSGHGKTTLLRIIAGFEKPDQGSIHLLGKKISPEQNAYDRGIGFLFQNFALFPHMTVAENILFPLLKQSKEQQKARLQEMLKVCDLGGSEKKRPHELSGGQQQRLALARALAPQPKILMMDEPFSNLDVELRARLSAEVRGILKYLGVTALIVTHHLEEAYDLADKIGVLERGRLLQWDTPYNLYHQPANEIVASFVDKTSFVEAEMGEDSHLYLGKQRISGKPLTGAQKGRKIRLLIRPDDIQHRDQSDLKAVVLNKYFRGSWFLYELEFDGRYRFYSYVPSHHNHAIGESIGIEFEIDHLIMYS